MTFWVTTSWLPRRRRVGQIFQVSSDDEELNDMQIPLVAILLLSSLSFGNISVLIAYLMWGLSIWWWWQMFLILMIDLGAIQPPKSPTNVFLFLFGSQGWQDSINNYAVKFWIIFRIMDLINQRHYTNEGNRKNVNEWWGVVARINQGSIMNEEEVQ